MAKRKVEVVLQSVIDNDAQWFTELEKQGLLVVDVYQDWAGPCKALVGTFRRLKTEIDDELLNFSMANSNKIKALSAYCGRCEPCFLFYGSGQLVAVLRGANPPHLELMIRTELEKEKLCLDGKKDRIQIVDPVLAAIEVAEAAERKRKAEMVEIDREISVIIIKPEIVASGANEEIKNHLIEDGFTIHYEKEILITADDAKEYYSYLDHEDLNLKGLIENISSNSCHLLIISKNIENSIQDALIKVGPLTYHEALETAPDSLVAKYGTSNIQNGLEASANEHHSLMALKLFASEFVPDKVLVHRPGRQSALKGRNEQMFKKMTDTMIVVRPSVWDHYGEDIVHEITNLGFEIQRKHLVLMKKEALINFYKDKKYLDKDTFDLLIEEMSSGPCLVLIISKSSGENIFEKVREILGSSDIRQVLLTEKTSLRGRFLPKVVREHLDQLDEKPGPLINGIHCSVNPVEFEKDSDFFLPTECACLVIKPDAFDNREEILDSLREAGLFIFEDKQFNMTHKLAEQLLSYQKISDQLLPQTIEQISSGPCLAVIARGEKSFSLLQKIIGDEDPDIAAETKPDSIRAKFGRDIIRNAVVYTSDTASSSAWITAIWGEEEANVLRGE